MLIMKINHKNYLFSQNKSVQKKIAQNSPIQCINHK